MINRSIAIQLAAVLILAGTFGLNVGCSTNLTFPQPPEVMHERFISNMRQLEGVRFEGEAVFMIEPDSQFEGEKLVAYVESFDRGVLRVPFHVGDDTSRTWIFRLSGKGLHLRHDHRDPDGTPHELTDYGGWATADGTAYRQSFPADDHTKELIPQASTNVWTIEYIPELGKLIYDLQRHDRPRFRAELYRVE